MKTVSKRAIAALIVAILAVGPTAAALPRDHSDRGIPKIVRILKQIFGISTHTDTPVPPRP
jgi:hypothetical protein